MLTFFLGFLLAGTLFLAISLQKTYHHVPIKELKRQANQGDEISQIFYKVVAFGFSLDMFLWAVIGVSAGGFFVFLSKNLPWPVAVFGCISCIWFGFAWLPGSHITRPGVIIAKLVAKPLAMLLEWLHTPLVKLSDFIARFRPVTVHTGLYTKDDLLEFVELQKTQIDNRVKKRDLTLVSQTLLLGDKTIGDIMTPWRKVKKVATHDMVGPILMDELHTSGLTHFPVYQGGDKKDIVGTLNIADMFDAKQGGFVKDIMIKRAHYLHEEEKVSDAFSTLSETKHPLFIVVNTREEMVGVVSISEILTHMIGELPQNDFGNHHDRSAVSKKTQPKITHVDATINLDDESEIEPGAEEDDKTETEIDK